MRLTTKYDSWTDKYLKEARGHIFIRGYAFDNPYLYSEIFILLIIFIPFFYFIIYSLRSQSISFKSKNYPGVGFCLAMITYQLGMSIIDNAFNYYYVHDYCYSFQFNLLFLMFFISSWDYIYQCFRIFTLIGFKFTKYLGYLCMFLKYYYLAYSLYRSIFLFVDDFTIYWKPYYCFIIINNYSYDILAALLYIVCTLFLTKEVQGIIPSNILSKIRAGFFLLCFGFLIDIIIDKVQITDYYICHVDLKIPAANLIYIMLNIISVLVRYIPLLYIISILSEGGKNEENEENKSELNSVII